MTTHLTRLLNNINTLSQVLEKLTRRKRRFKMTREHIETAFDIGGVALSLLSTKYTAAAKAAGIVQQLHARITREKPDDSHRKRNTKTGRTGNNSDRPIPIRPAQPE